MCEGGGEGRFAIVTTQLRTGVLEALVVGELDLATGPQLRATVLAELGASTADVDLVLSDVTFIDSTGVAALLELRTAVLAREGTFRLVAPARPVLDVLDLSGLGDLFEID